MTDPEIQRAADALADKIVDALKVCGFCKGGPVGNAATWVDGKPRPPAPCPRCGETYREAA